jgi:hypothetical protein
MDFNTLTTEQQQIITDIVKELIADKAVNSAGKKARKIKLSKKDLQIAFFMKNEMDLGRFVGTASNEDLIALIGSVSGANNAAEIEKLKAEREEYQAKASELSKKINALKLSKGPAIIIS